MVLTHLRSGHEHPSEPTPRARPLTQKDRDLASEGLEVPLLKGLRWGSGHSVLVVSSVDPVPMASRALWLASLNPHP